jgi:hypothetical protein
MPKIRVEPLRLLAQVESNLVYTAGNIDTQLGFGGFSGRTGGSSIGCGGLPGGFGGSSMGFGGRSGGFGGSSPGPGAGGSGTGGSGACMCRVIADVIAFACMYIVCIT